MESRTRPPGIKNRRGRVLVEKERLQRSLVKRGQQAEMLVAPEATNLCVFLLGHDPEDPDRLEVVGQRRRRAACEVVKMNCHGAPPVVPVLSSGSTVMSLEARRSAAISRASR